MRVWKGIASGAKDTPIGAQGDTGLRPCPIIFVPELTRWGRSMLDLMHTLQDLQAWNVSLIAQTGRQLDLHSAQGKLIASLMAALAEFERALLRERVRCGSAAAKQRGVRFGRQHCYRPTAQRYSARVPELVRIGLVGATAINLTRTAVAAICRLRFAIGRSLLDEERISADPEQEGNAQPREHIADPRVERGARTQWKISNDHGEARGRVHF